MTRALRLASVNHSPAIRRAPKPAPLISSEARRKERAGERFYDRANLKPTDLPSTYLALTSYPPRVERRSWRTLVAVAVGAIVGLAALGTSGNLMMAFALGGISGLAIVVSDGWVR